MEGAGAEAEVVGPPGWFEPQIPAGAHVLSESPIAYTLDNLLTGAYGRWVAVVAPPASPGARSPSAVRLIVCALLLPQTMSATT